MKSDINEIGIESFGDNYQILTKLGNMEISYQAYIILRDEYKIPVGKGKGDKNE